MRRFVLAGGLVLLLASSAEAQSSINVNINQARLVWGWVQGAPPEEGIPDKFNVKCGQTAGVYTRITEVPFKADPSNTYSLGVRQAIAGTGPWFCVVSAQNAFGESGATNEVPFVAGATASRPSGLSVVAQ